ncbi:hypothetical protein [Gephyromycinifex aptenodytis]|uniref:hypothetical protein n=1 Tax=Gephyromycinifex aptenodytis TaxID=2716227 RepID=UPI001447B34C|nr:hypothetical protein [Gephyromycinifex aptenodytis]
MSTQLDTAILPDDAKVVSPMDEVTRTLLVVLALAMAAAAALFLGLKLQSVGGMVAAGVLAAASAGTYLTLVRSALVGH